MAMLFICERGQELGKLTAEVNQLRAAEALQLDEIAQIGKDPWLDVSGNGVYMGISREKPMM